MPRPRRRRILCAGLTAGALALTACGAGPSHAEDELEAAPSCAEIDLTNPPEAPTEIQLGVQPSTIEPFAIQYEDPEFANAEHYGDWYTVNADSYPPADRLDAFQAGDIDGGTASIPQLVRAVAQGLPLRSVASVALEADDGFLTTFASLEGSGITDVSDLEDKRIGILDP